MSLLPSDPPEQVVIQRASLQPSRRDEPLSKWEKFLNFLRLTIGLKPLYLAERWAEASVFEKETDNQVKLWKAKAEYEQVMAEVQRTKAEAEKLRSEARNKAANARVRELAARHLESITASPEEAAEKIKTIVEEINKLGGVVEFQIPGDEETEV